MTDNVAVLQGYIEEIEGEYEGCTLNLLVRPGEDTSQRFKAWDMEIQEFIWVNGWVTEFHAV